MNCIILSAFVVSVEPGVLRMRSFVFGVVAALVVGAGVVGAGVVASGASAQTPVRWLSQTSSVQTQYPIESAAMARINSAGVGLRVDR
jgi:hypothetical protein